MIKLWLSVSLVLVNVNACKVERCLMRHLLSAAPRGLCCSWLEFVPQSRSSSTKTQQQQQQAQPQLQHHWQKVQKKLKLRSSALESSRDALCPTGHSAWGDPPSKPCNCSWLGHCNRQKHWHFIWSPGNDGLGCWGMLALWEMAREGMQLSRFKALYPLKCPALG